MVCGGVAFFFVYVVDCEVWQDANPVIMHASYPAQRDWGFMGMDLLYANNVAGLDLVSSACFVWGERLQGEEGSL
jgi:hypothetical protein